MNEPGNLLGIIPARGGSKGLPSKNIAEVKGRPLIAWTITAALKSSSISRLILSSDDADIVQQARTWGCDAPFIRPAELATDEASSIDVVLHALEQMPGYDYVALLQPTSPLRTAKDIDAAYALMMETGAPSCVSVCLANQNPYWMVNLREDRTIEYLLSPEKRATRRQDLPPTYRLNGAIYICRVDWLLKTRDFMAEGCVAYCMDQERSLDIDTFADLEFARAIL